MKIIRVRSIFIILMLLLSTFAIISVSGETDKPEEKPIMVVKGTISVAETDKVIQKAWVYIHNDAFELEIHTNEHGFYSAELPPGWYVIKVGAEGYYEQKAEIKGETDVEIIQDFYLKPIKVEPSDEGLVLCGIVTDERENPIAWAVVGIERIIDEGETDDRAYHTRTETNEEGYYKFTELKEGWYFIYAEAEEYHEYFNEIKIPFEELESTDKENMYKHHIILERFREDEGRCTALHGHVFDACTDRPLPGASVILTRGAFQPLDWEAIKDPCPPEDPERPPEPPKERPDEPKNDEGNDKEERPEKEGTRCGDDCERKKDKDCGCRPKEPEVEEFFMWRIKTNDDGFYEFPCLMPGHYNLWGIAEGYITFYNEYDIHGEGFNVNIYLRPMLFEKPPERKPNALIKGHVFDEETQEPLAGVKVIVLEPEKAFQPDLLDEKPKDEDPTVKERPKEEPEGKRGEGCGDCEKDRKYEDKDKPIEPDYQFPYTTTTDRNGYFELKIPSGANVLVVMAEGYYKYVEKFVIEPEGELTVRVPMEVMGEEGKRLLNEGELDGEESSEADTKGSSWLPSGPEATGAILNSILAGLLVVLVILSMFVFRKYKRKPVTKIKKTK